MVQQPFLQLGNFILEGKKLRAVDVGGAGGLLPHWANFEGNTQFYMYEPHDESFQKLEQVYINSPFRQDFHFIKTALSGTGGVRKFYATNSPTSSSLLRPNISDERYANSPSFVPFQEKVVRTQTLAESLDGEGVEAIDIIKLDIQGTELEVLKSLDQARWNKLLAVELEIGLIDIYEGAPSFGEVFDHFVKNGFELFDLRTQREPRYLQGTEQTYQQSIFGVEKASPSIASKVYEVDALFVRDPRTLAGDDMKLQVRKMIFCQCIYNFFAEAMYLVTESKLSQLFSQQELAALQEAIKIWQQLNRQITQGYENVLRSTNFQVWGQYAWVPYPCM